VLTSISKMLNRTAVIEAINDRVTVDDLQVSIGVINLKRKCGFDDKVPLIALCRAESSVASLGARSGYQRAETGSHKELKRSGFAQDYSVMYVPCCARMYVPRCGLSVRADLPCWAHMYVPCCARKFSRYASENLAGTARENLAGTCAKI